MIFSSNNGTEVSENVHSFVFSRGPATMNMTGKVSPRTFVTTGALI